MPIRKGGLKLIDLQEKEIALKATWVKKMLNEQMTFWKEYLNSKLPEDAPDFFECNISEKDMCKILSESCIENSIVTAICKNWCKVNYHIPKNVQEILEQKIWNNSHIKIGGALVNDNPLRKFNITKIKDIFDYEKKEIYDIKSMKEIYGNIGNYLEFYSLKSSIHKMWKQEFSKAEYQTREAFEHSNLEKLENAIRCTKWVYDSRLKGKKVAIESVDEARLICNSKLSINVDKEEWQKILLMGYYTTLSTKLRVFQYKLLSRKLTTNYTLGKWNNEIDSRCTFCKREEETKPFTLRMY